MATGVRSLSRLRPYLRPNYRVLKAGRVLAHPCVIRAAECVIDCRSHEAAKRGGLILYFDCPDLEKGRARAPGLPLFAVGVDPRFDYFPGVRRLDNLALLRRMASQLRKAKPRSILASDGNLPRCHQRHMGRRREGITPALFRNKAAQFLSTCRRARRSVSRSLVSSGQAPTAAKPTQPLATWPSPSKRRPRCSMSQAGRHRHRFCNRRPLAPTQSTFKSQYPINRRAANVQPLRNHSGRILPSYSAFTASTPAWVTALHAALFVSATHFCSLAYFKAALSCSRFRPASRAIFSMAASALFIGNEPCIDQSPHKLYRSFPLHPVRPPVKLRRKSIGIGAVAALSIFIDTPNRSQGAKQTFQ